MRYAQGGGLTAEGRSRRERVRLAAAEKFEQRIPVPQVAAQLRVSERSVQRWHRTWEAGGVPALASRGRRPGTGWTAASSRNWTGCGTRTAKAGWEDQRWTLARVRDLIAARFRVRYTVPGTWYLLRRRGWSCQLGARRPAERDDGGVEVWKKETWPAVKEQRRPSAPGSSSRTRPASR